ncbi:MAG: NAD(P)-dependent alcohol dehydrogenase [bacterium]
MKAAVYRHYGSPSVLQVRDVPRPEPGANEVLIRVHATSVSRTDCGYLRAHPFFIRLMTGLRRPKRTVLGMDFAGEVEALGAGVTSFAAGDRVFGIAPGDRGAHAEYICVPEGGAVAVIPPGLNFDAAVACEGALYADSCLRSIGLRAGQSILIYGASGAIGTAAVQLAKSYGAQVTAVVATRHIELATSLGADKVIDYTKEDFTERGQTFDFVLDAVGKTTYHHCRKLLNSRGVFAATDLGPWGQTVFLSWWFAILKSRRVVIPFPRDRKAFVDFLADEMKQDKFRAVIDRHYPIESIADAYRYVERGEKTGIVVINVVSPI